MNWMSLTQLNIFVIIMFVVLVIIISFIISGFGGQIDENKVRMRELEKEVNELKNHIK